MTQQLGYDILLMPDEDRPSADAIARAEAMLQKEIERRGVVVLDSREVLVEHPRTWRKDVWCDFP